MLVFSAIPAQLHIMCSVALECSCFVPLNVNVVSVNDPFIPLGYLVHQAKCDTG